MNTTLLFANAETQNSNIDSPINGALLALLIVLIVLSIILLIVALYAVASVRRKSIVLKKIDYLVEDITYKSESLNVTVETLNKISNYALSLDAVSKNGFKSTIKFISENRNYIYSILEKMRNDVEAREKSKKTKKASSSKTSTKNNTKKTTTNKSSSKSSNKNSAKTTKGDE